MERKRKLPARAAARVEHVSKKRNSTPPEVSTASTPSTSPQPADSAPQEPPQPPPSSSAALPRSIQPGQPLPTVEKPQPDDLPQKEYQSVQESGVMAESLSRSRQKWIHDGVFEKYWTKPTKRKGVVKEDANNPAKDTMTKIGQVTITVEPHLLEATMYAVKDPKPTPMALSTSRPVIQYGPPNGIMPPPNSATAPAAASAAADSSSKAPAQGAKPPSQSTRADEQAPTQPLSSIPAPPLSPLSQLHREQSAATELPLISGRDLKSVLAAPQPAQTPVSGPGHARPSQPPLSQPHAPSTHPLHAPAASPAPAATSASLPPAPVGGVKTTPPPPKPATTSASGADPIIVTLAERASEDPHLRDLMKRVAVGEAASHELAHFQKIIDQITQDYKKKGGQQGPSAERLMVDGRTVKYFADEVRTILDIILTSNPNQRSSDLRPPPGSDPLVILLVKEVLDRPISKALVLRVAEGKMKFNDATEMKSLLERLLLLIKQDVKARQAAATPNANAMVPTQPTQPKAEDTKKSPTPGATAPQSAPASQQALRSKGPPPPAKPDIAAVVLEFAGGTGDRYLFPKYSILEFSADGTEVIASFLIVRRGSKLEYGGDRALDYYQPVTLRLHSQNPKVLENLARVVAPEEDVRRYMDDVMDNMTRAEYILLAMRLPKADKDDTPEERSDTPKGSETSHPAQMSGALWDNRPPTARPASARPASATTAAEDEQYQRFIASIS